jgi:hypothetical protein
LFEKEQLQRNKIFHRSKISLGKEGDECLYEGNAPWIKGGKKEKKQEKRTRKNKFFMKKRIKIKFTHGGKDE